MTRAKTSEPPSQFSDLVRALLELSHPVALSKTHADSDRMNRLGRTAGQLRTLAKQLKFGSIFDCIVTKFARNSSLMSWDSTFLNVCKQAASAYKARNREVVRLIVEISALAEERGLEVAVVKGLAIQACYPDFIFRRQNDIDLLLKAKDFDQWDALFSEMDLCAPAAGDPFVSFSLEHRNEKGYLPRHPGVFEHISVIHLMTSPSWNSEPYLFNTNKLLDRRISRPWDGEFRFSTLAPMDHFIVLCTLFYQRCTELVRVLAGDDLNLRKLLDIAMYGRAHSQSIGWNDLRKVAFATNAELAVDFCLRQVEIFFPGSLPAVSLELTDSETVTAEMAIRSASNVLDWREVGRFDRPYSERIFDDTRFATLEKLDDRVCELYAHDEWRRSFPTTFNREWAQSRRELP